MIIHSPSVAVSQPDLRRKNFTVARLAEGIGADHANIFRYEQMQAVRARIQGAIVGRHSMMAFMSIRPERIKVHTKVTTGLFLSHLLFAVFLKLGFIDTSPFAFRFRPMLRLRGFLFPGEA